jgi:hypothetical protein
VPPAQYYDFLSVAGTPQTQAFAHISETGVIKIPYQLSAAGGYPNLSYNLLYGPDGNIYGIGNEQHGSAPTFLFRVTQSGTYRGCRTLQ